MMTILSKIEAVFPMVAFIATLTIVSTRPVSAQGAPSRSQQIPYSPTLQPDSGQTMTYFEFPFQRLKEVVPALKGLNYDASQEQLDSILTQVAKTIASVLPRLPDLVSRESISGFQVPGSLSTAGGLAIRLPAK